ncbi:MAG: DNA polymerase sliding clamp [Candidatus Aenigmatarchaeota archaeon]|nr:DNA polymerase sliding clamp [Nanoarchaeota archaeon]
MFKLKLADIDLLRNSIPIISEIIDEGIFKFEKDGISLISPDRTMVSVVDFKILSSAFEEYDLQEPENIGLSLGHLVSIIKRATSEDKMIIESTGKNKLKIVLQGSGTRTFHIPIIDVSVEKPPLDQLNFGGKIELESRIVEQGISDADVIGDSVIFEASPGLFKMSSKGDTTSVELEMMKESAGILGINVDKQIRAQYPLEYLKKMIKANKLAKQIVLEFGTDYPIRLSFKQIDKLQLNFILAPRVIEE